MNPNGSTSQFERSAAVLVLAGLAIFGAVHVVNAHLRTVEANASSTSDNQTQQTPPTTTNQTQTSSATDPNATSKQKRVQIGLPGSSTGIPPLPGTSISPTTGHESVPTSEQLHPVNAAESDPEKTKKGSFLFAPIPVSNEAIGVGVFGIGAYIFPLNKRDDVSPPSIVGVGGGYVSKGSWGGAAYAQLYMKQDRLRFTGAFGHGDVKLNLYGSGTSAGNTGLSVPYAQNGNFYFFQGLVRVSKNVFVGSRFKSVSTAVTIGLTGVVPAQFNLPGLGLHQQATSLGIVSERDTRNSTFYPTAGTDSGIHIDFFEPNLGSNFRYQNYDLYFNKYAALTNNQVIAFRVYGCAASGEIVPFTQLCQFGSSNDIRGYEAGRYRDRLMFAIQSEYRLHLRFPQKYPRFGIVVFGGIGEVAPTFKSFRFDNLLPAGGAGLRYRLSKTYPVNFRLDGAYGKNGSTYMFSVGEAF